jgi:hypothetical protein
MWPVARHLAGIGCSAIQQGLNGSRDSTSPCRTCFRSGRSERSVVSRCYTDVKVRCDNVHYDKYSAGQGDCQGRPPVVPSLFV